MVKSKADRTVQNRTRTKLDAAAADDIALRALAFLATDEARLWRFLDLTGLAPDTLRAAAGRPGFTAAVLDHVASDESLLMAVADGIGETPERVAQAQAVLSPQTGFD